MSDKTVKLFNKDFVISTEKYNALAIQNMFRNLANDAFDEYTEFFNKNITDLKDLVTSCPKVIGGVFHNTSKKIVERLSKYDIYDISSDTIEQTFIDNGKALDAYELLCDKYEAILDNQAELDAYRTARRQNRGRVVGGGFGLSGAVKGMATAGAMNMAAGAAHGAFNMAGKVASSIGAAIEKDSIFSSEKSSKTIAHGIWKDIYCAYNTYMNILQKNNKFRFQVITQDDADKAKTLFQNSRELVSDIEKKKELYFQILQLDGTEDEYYSYGLKTFPEEAKNLIDIAKIHYTDISEHIEKFLNDILNALSVETEEDTLKAKKVIQSKMNELELENSKAMDKINELLYQFDIQARTYKNVLYDTRENCKKACKDDKTIISTIMSRFDKTADRDTLMNLLDEVKCFKTFDSVKKEYIETIDKCIIAIEEGVLQELCKGLEQSDEKTCNDMKANIKSSIARESLKKQYLQLVDNKIEKIWSAEDGQVFDNVLLKTNFEDAKSINDSISYIANNGRTESKETYLKALNSINEKNLKKALLYLKIQKSIIKYILHVLAVIFFIAIGVSGEESVISNIGVFYFILYIAIWIYYYSCKKIYNLLTINGTVINKIFKK